MAGTVRIDLPKSAFFMRGPGVYLKNILDLLFQAGSEEIQKNTVCHGESQTYRYQPRCMYAAEPPYGPYPEVVAYDRQEDGTLKLIIHAVWEIEESDCAFSSELTVRPMEDGRYQYISNLVISSDTMDVAKWYTPRLTDQEWEEKFSESCQ